MNKDLLPDEIYLSEVFSYLGPKELGRLATTCKFFNNLCSDNQLWRSKLQALTGASKERILAYPSWLKINQPEMLEAIPVIPGSRNSQVDYFKLAASYSQVIQAINLNKKQLLKALTSTSILGMDIKHLMHFLDQDVSLRQEETACVMEQYLQRKAAEILVPLNRLCSQFLTYRINFNYLHYLLQNNEIADTLPPSSTQIEEVPIITLCALLGDFAAVKHLLLTSKDRIWDKLILKEGNANIFQIPVIGCLKPFKPVNTLYLDYEPEDEDEETVLESAKESLDIDMLLGQLEENNHNVQAIDVEEDYDDTELMSIDCRQYERPCLILKSQGDEQGVWNVYMINEAGKIVNKGSTFFCSNSNIPALIKKYGAQQEGDFLKFTNADDFIDIVMVRCGLIPEKEPRMDIFTYLLPYLREQSEDFQEECVLLTCQYRRLDMFQLLIKEGFTKVSSNGWKEIENILINTPNHLSVESLPAINEFIDFIRAHKTEKFPADFKWLEDAKETRKILKMLVKNDKVTFVDEEQLAGRIEKIKALPEEESSEEDELSSSEAPTKDSSDNEDETPKRARFI